MFPGVAQVRFMYMSKEVIEEASCSRHRGLSVCDAAGSSVLALQPLDALAMALPCRAADSSSNNFRGQILRPVQQ